MGGLNAGELTQGEVKELYAKAQEAEADKDTFSIYQLKQGDETRDFRFEPYDRLQAAGNVVDKTNYELVYSAELTPGTSLEDIYTRFNIDHPKDFKGHSLSVSDVVVLHQNGQDAAHYVDSFGYKEVPEFLQEQTQQPEKINPLKHVEDTIEQNDNNFDGIINNTPTVDELEAKVKAGEQISLVDLAEAIKADKEKIRIRIKGYDHQVVDQAAEKIVQTAKRTGARVSGPVPLPTEKQIVTILRAVHKYKDSREQFEMRTHKRLIDILRPSNKTVEALMGLELPAGVEIEIKL